MAKKVVYKLGTDPRIWQPDSHPRIHFENQKRQFDMKSANDKSTRTWCAKLRTPYVAPSLRLLSLREGKALLLRTADTNDSEVRYMLRRIEEVKASQNSDAQRKGSAA